MEATAAREEEPPTAKEAMEGGTEDTVVAMEEAASAGMGAVMVEEFPS